MDELNPRWPRRRVLKAISAAGVGTAVFGRALVALAADKPAVTKSMIREAEWIAGVEFTDGDRKLMLEGVNDALKDFAKLRAVEIDNAVPPALVFSPARCTEEGDPGTAVPAPPADVRTSPGAAPPSSPDEIAFATVGQLAAMLRARSISSVELTRLYLERLARFDPVLKCVITLTEEMALRQAEAADTEIASGKYRGPLHGIPWGAKDLLAVAGYRTTWGSAPYKDQVRAETATVAQRLEVAGAVLLA